MDTGSDGESNRDLNQSPLEGQKKPKRQMKTPFQLEILEKTYASTCFFWLICFFLIFKVEIFWLNLTLIFHFLFYLLLI